VTLTRNVFFILLAVVLFLVAVILQLGDNLEPDVFNYLLFGGLASFAAGHL
jgi:hypothetical protein